MVNLVAKIKKARFIKGFEVWFWSVQKIGQEREQKLLTVKMADKNLNWRTSVAHIK